MVPFLIVGALGTAVGALTAHAVGEKDRQEAQHHREIANELLKKYSDIQKRYDELFKASKQQIEDLKDKLCASELEKDILYVAIRLQQVLTSQMDELGKEPSCEMMVKIKEAVFQVNLFLAQIDEDLVQIESSYFIKNLQRIEHSLTSDIEVASYWYLLGQIFHADIDDCKEAIVYYDKSLEVQSNNYKCWVKKGDALVQVGRYKEALSSYNTAISIEANDPDIWYAQSRVHHLLGNLEDELKTIQVVLAFNAEYAQSLYMRGVLLEKLDVKAEAIEYYNQALHLDCNIAEAYYRRGLLRLILGDPLSEQDYVLFKQGGREDLEKAKVLFVQQGKQVLLPPERSCNLVCH